MLLDVEMDLTWSFLMTTYMTGVRHDMFRPKYLLPDRVPSKHGTLLLLGITTHSKPELVCYMFRDKLFPDSFPFQA